MELESLQDAVHHCGQLPKADNLDINQIIRALQARQEERRRSDQLGIAEGIGSPRIVSGSEISAKLLRLSLRTGLKSAERQKDKSH